MFLIGHAKAATNAAEIAGNVTVNISGGEINVIKTARSQWESIKGDLTINVKGDAKIGAVTLDTTKFDLEKTQKLNIQVKDMGLRVRMPLLFPLQTTVTGRIRQVRRTINSPIGVILTLIRWSTLSSEIWAASITRDTYSVP